ncbi:hypothetical protein VHEMI10033 [[Torrubiella] hemipterigena]|uniref:Small acidic protein n=1 Tax=[Torrubiella] hemipterigena TaxID=1531966 RepID=A0A0A1THS1_9HYPO|nr:hypothetical protein VHEMI10033 [[Torrubiella] hemipterigena]
MAKVKADRPTKPVDPETAKASARQRKSKARKEIREKNKKFKAENDKTAKKTTVDPTTRLADFKRKHARLSKRITRHKTLIEKLKTDLRRFEAAEKSSAGKIAKLEKEVGTDKKQDEPKKDKKTVEKKKKVESESEDEDDDDDDDDKDTSSEEEDGSDSGSDSDSDSSDESDKDKSRKRKRDDEPTPSKKAKKEKSKKEKDSKKESKKDDEAPATDVKLGNWNISELEGGSARQSKFMRLLGGGKKAADEIAKSGAKSSKRDSLNVEEAIERQFQEGMARKSDGGGKRRGLGA